MPPDGGLADATPHGDATSEPDALAAETGALSDSGHTDD